MSERVLQASLGAGGGISYLVPDTGELSGQKVLRQAHTTFLTSIIVANRVVGLRITGKDGNVAFFSSSDFQQTNNLLFGYTWGLITGQPYADLDSQEVAVPLDDPVILPGDTIDIVAQNIDVSDIFSTVLLSFD